MISSLFNKTALLALSLTTATSLFAASAASHRRFPALEIEAHIEAQVEAHIAAQVQQFIAANSGPGLPAAFKQFATETLLRESFRCSAKIENALSEAQILREQTAALLPVGKALSIAIKEDAKTTLAVNADAGRDLINSYSQLKAALIAREKRLVEIDSRILILKEKSLSQNQAIYFLVTLIKRIGLELYS